MPVPSLVPLTAVLLGGLFPTGCNDQGPVSLDIDEPTVLSAARSDPESASGCVVLTVDVSDPTEVMITATTDPDCGPVIPVVDGEATLDPLSRVLRIPIAAENGGALPLADPAYLESWDNLLEVVTGGIAGEVGLVVFLDADSTEVAGIEEEEVVRFIWRYEEEVPERDGQPFLEPGQRTEARWIELVVDPTVEVFSVEMHGHAEVPAEWVGRRQVPSVAPDTVPEGFYDLSNFHGDNACVTGPVMRGIVVVVFHHGTPQAARQEAVDLIEGEVVGGLRSTNREGYYYVRVEEEEEGQIACEAMETLKELPQVSLAVLSVIDDSSHRRPNDEGAWTSGAWPDSVHTMDGETVFWIGLSGHGEGVVLGRGRGDITVWAWVGRPLVIGDEQLRLGSPPHCQARTGRLEVPGRMARTRGAPGVGGAAGRKTDRWRRIAEQKRSRGTGHDARTPQADPGFDVGLTLVA